MFERRSAKCQRCRWIERLGASISPEQVLEIGNNVGSVADSQRVVSVDIVDTDVAHGGCAPRFEVTMQVVAMGPAAANHDDAIAHFQPGEHPSG